MRLQTLPSLCDLYGVFLLIFRVVLFPALSIFSLLHTHTLIRSQLKTWGVHALFLSSVCMCISLLVSVYVHVRSSLLSSILPCKLYLNCQNYLYSGILRGPFRVPPFCVVTWKLFHGIALGNYMTNPVHFLSLRNLCLALPNSQCLKSMFHIFYLAF